MGSDEPRRVVRLRPKQEPDVVFAPELLLGSDSPFYNQIYGGTPAQVRWIRSLRGYLTIYYGWRDLIPPDLFPPSEHERWLFLPTENDEQLHAEWVKGAFRCLLS